MSVIWKGIAGLSGASAIGLGAIGAHRIQYKSDKYKDIYKTGANYHLINSVALLTSAVIFKGRKRNIVCTLFSSGILLFSGSCYMVGYKGINKPVLGKNPAPIGGLLLMSGWLTAGTL
jgi:uncharacterized membrane protein YgdD (TMEM256/DUF423 family)